MKNILLYMMIVITMAGIPTSVAAKSCYDIGYRYGQCVARRQFNLSCSDPNIVIPINCRGKKNTQKGVRDGIKAVYKNNNNNIKSKQYLNTDTHKAHVETNEQMLLSGSGLKAYKRGDYKSAFNIFSTLAAQGDAGSQTMVGCLYANGMGVAQDYANALYWFRKAAAQGNANGQCSLGMMYSNGYGVKQDDAKSFYWYNKAAAQGNHKAQFIVGLTYYSGLGIGKNNVSALKWLILASIDGRNQQRIKWRDGLSKIMTPAQVAEAQRMARSFSPNASMK